MFNRKERSFDLFFIGLSFSFSFSLDCGCGYLDIFFVMIIYSLEYATFLSSPNLTIPHDSLIFSRCLDPAFELASLLSSFNHLHSSPIHVLCHCTSVLNFFFASGNFLTDTHGLQRHNNERVCYNTFYYMCLRFCYNNSLLITSPTLPSRASDIVTSKLSTKNSKISFSLALSNEDMPGCSFTAIIRK